MNSKEKEPVSVKVELKEELKGYESDQSANVKEEIFESLPPKFICKMPTYDQNNDLDMEQMQEKFRLFPEMLYSERWKKSSKKNGVEISVYEDEAYTGIKGSLEFPYNYKIVNKVLNQPEIPFKANVFHDHLDILETFENTKIAYMKFKGFLMVDGRDFITSNTSTYMYDENSQGKNPESF